MIGRLFQVSSGYSTTALVAERGRGTVAVWLAARPATVVATARTRGAPRIPTARAVAPALPAGSRSALGPGTVPHAA